MLVEPKLAKSDAFGPLGDGFEIIQGPRIIGVEGVHPSGVPEPIVRFGQVGRPPPIFDSCGDGNRPSNPGFGGSIQHLGGSTERFVIGESQVAVGVEHDVVSLRRMPCFLAN